MWNDTYSPTVNEFIFGNKGPALSPGPAGWYEVCGTSEAGPRFAGIVALADQVAGHPLGLISPALYFLSAVHAPGPVDAALFVPELARAAGGRWQLSSQRPAPRTRSNGESRSNAASPEYVNNGANKAALACIARTTGGGSPCCLVPGI